jgi:3-oxoacyl-[acyl-carrier-protein] synthase III
VGEYIAPNDLALVHAELGLPAQALVLPLADEYTVFNSSLVVADSVLRSGRARRALIVCGCNWTAVVDYRTPPSISAGDGAGAAVVVAGLPAAGGGGSFRFVDHRRATASGYYGHMFVAPDGSGVPRFSITDAGYAAMGRFIGSEVPQVVLDLLAAQGLRGDQVTLLCHQTSQTFLDRWAEVIGPKELLHTLAEYGNMTSATLPVNLDVFAGRVTTEFVVLLGIGVQWQADAVLLARV